MSTTSKSENPAEVAPAQTTCKCPGFLCSCHHQATSDGHTIALPATDPVEAAAEAIFNHRAMSNPREPFTVRCGCDQTFKTAVERQRHAAQAVIDAAAPLIRLRVADEIAAKGNEIAEQFQATAVTHQDLSHEHGRTLKGTSHMTTAHAYRNKADGAWAVMHAARDIGGQA